MGRPRLPLGTAGEIRTYPVKRTFEGKEKVIGYRAVCKFRDRDGKVRPVERRANTKASAISELKKAVRDRKGPGRGNGEITADTRLSVVGEIYLKKVEADVKAGAKSPGTYDAYEYTYNNHVKEELGDLTVAEAKVWVLDEHLEFVRDDVSVPTAKLTRTVLSGMMKIAVKHDAIDRNPVRDCSRIEGGRRRSKPRALTTDERERWRAQLLADEDAVRRDLPDICDGQMATGTRIGEQLAVSGQTSTGSTTRSRSTGP